MPKEKIYDNQDEDLKGLENPEWYEDTLKDIQNLPETDDDLEKSWNADNSGYDESNPASKAKKDLSSKEIDNQEAGVETDSGQDAAVDDRESAQSKAEEGLYEPGGQESPKRFRGQITKKRALVGGGIITALIGGFSLFTFLSKPLELLHLDFALGKHEQSHDFAISSRVKRLFYRSAIQRNDPRLVNGRSRLGYVSNRAFSGALDRLEANTGARFLGAEGFFSGTNRAMQINALRGSPLIGADADATRSNIAREFGLAPDDITVTMNGQGARVNLQRLNSRQLDAVVDGLARNTNGGRFTSKLNPKVTKSINKRMWRKVLNAPSIFHPISRASSSVGRRIDNSVLSRRARKQADAERTRKTSKIRDRITQQRERVRSFVSGSSGLLTTISAAVAVQGVVCMIKDASTILPGAYYATLVSPSMIRGLQARSVASQMMSGQDFTSEQIGDVLADFSDSGGGSIWGGQALNALSNGGSGIGQDISEDARIAFNTKGSSIVDLVEAFNLSAVEPAAEIAEDFADFGCGFWARLAGLAAGVGITVLGILATPVTGGTSTAAVLGRVTTQAGLAAVVSYGLSRLIGEAVDSTVRGKVTDACGVEFDDNELDTEAEDIEVLDAESFGNCLAFAGRMESNISAASMGSIPISPSDESAILREANQRELAAFKEKSLVERLFSTKDKHSLVMAMSRPSSNYGDVKNGNFSSLAAGLLETPVSLTNNLASAFGDKAYAQEVTYDWGFATNAMPISLLENQAYADPVENANWIADNRDALDDERIEKCFGVRLLEGSEGIQTELLENEINPLSDDYNDSNCGSGLDEIWARTVLFVMDDAIARAADCYDGKASACAELGLTLTGPSNTTSSPGAVDPASLGIDCNQGNAQIVCVALQGMLGVPYKNVYSEVPGCKVSAVDEPTETNPTKLDCSAFTRMAVYRAYGTTEAPSTSVSYRSSPLFQEININEVRPGDLVGRGSVASGAGGNGHIGIVARYQNGGLTTVETNACADPSRVIERSDHGTYEWAVRYIGTGSSP